MEIMDRAKGGWNQNFLKRVRSSEVECIPLRLAVAEKLEIQHSCAFSGISLL